ncbi:aminotransferase class V-fold PLP-dependent enzyme [Flavivirga spongiicola]|uniref:Aminotransferase class V-fold PLP-dependent enzyme n=1 Tax=Flavivirga spongiicola TaxID=421621 RepID=A0ABU7XYP8_9FLAO|nr:aminotransferase class V-fold PLP-dependent enzyme [Flavivirga sp. MEBiC05379]MDO5980916.1 aminotransferase class V-fold PLP-dependent enzyme [Flavivirga sp. MEBiC05379]
MKNLFNHKYFFYDVNLPCGEQRRYVNLDNAATTPPFASVENGVLNDLIEYGSVHRGAGKKSKISTNKYEEARDTVKKFVNARQDDYAVFVPNTTSGINVVAYMFSQIKGKILVSDIEHSSSLIPWMFHEGRHQNKEQVSLEDALKNNTETYNDTILTKGREKVIVHKTKEDFSFNLKDIESVFKENSSKLPDDRIKLLVVTGKSNVTGYRAPIKQMSKIAHMYGAMVLLDACQLLQHEKLDVREEDVDFALFSGHKMYAPFGSGAIVGNKKIFDAFWPYQIGGGNFPYISASGEIVRVKNEQAHESGTPNYVGARALHFSIKQLLNIGFSKIKTHELNLVNRAYIGLKSIKGLILYVNENKDGLLNTSLLIFNLKKFPCRLLAEILNDEYGIGTRAGSYCVYEFSRRIMNVKSDEKILEQAKFGNMSLIPGSVRVSFGLENEEEDVSYLVNAIRTVSGNGVDYYLTKYSQLFNSGEFVKNATA